MIHYRVYHIPIHYGVYYTSREILFTVSVYRARDTHTRFKYTALHFIIQEGARWIYRCKLWKPKFPMCASPVFKTQLQESGAFLPNLQ